METLDALIWRPELREVSQFKYYETFNEAVVARALSTDDARLFRVNDHLAAMIAVDLILGYRFGDSSFHAGLISSTEGANRSVPM